MTESESHAYEIATYAENSMDTPTKLKTLDNTGIKSIQLPLIN
jgi:hypothetical protein